MPTSQDPQKRANQLANLRRGGQAGAPAGNAFPLKHGARTTTPQRSPLWSPAVNDAIADLAARVGDELRAADGALAAWAVPSVEAVAVLRVAVLRGERICAGLEDQGKLSLEDTERHAKVAERYHRALEREALTLRSRLDAVGTTASLAERLSDLEGRAA